jgi:hypothetical protein
VLLLQPLKSDQEPLDEFLEALEQTGSPVKNAVLRAALGWEKAQYEAVKAELVARRIVVPGRGRSDSVNLAGAESVAAPPPRGGNGPRASRNARGKTADQMDKSLLVFDTNPDLPNQLQRVLNEIEIGFAPSDPCALAECLTALGVSVSDDQLSELAPRLHEVLGRHS